jgi:hypothetical protein
VTQAAEHLLCKRETKNLKPTSIKKKKKPGRSICEFFPQQLPLGRKRKPENAEARQYSRPLP